MELSFSNGLIKAYFEGNNEYIPTSELIYVHEHPLIQNSFLTEIERMVNQATEVLIRKKITGVVIERFIEATMKLGAELPSITRENAPMILEQLRVVYKLCNNLLNK